MTDIQPQPSPAPAPAPNPTASDPAAPAAPSPTPVRPEGLPDHYWDAATGPRLNELVTDFNKLSTENAKQAEVFKEFPVDVKEAGKFYKLPENLLPDGVKLPDGVTVEPDTALLAKVLPVLHQRRADPALFQDLAKAVTGHRLEMMQAAHKDFVEDDKKLGANAATRRQAIATGLAAIVGPEAAKFVDTSIITSGAVNFFEALLAKVVNQGNVVPIRPGQNDPPPTQPQKIEDRWYGSTPQKAS